MEFVLKKKTFKIHLDINMHDILWDQESKIICMIFNNSEFSKDFVVFFSNELHVLF